MTKGRLIIAGVIALFSLVSYCSMQDVNPITGEKQYVALNQDEEIALGLQAAPELAQQFGGLDLDNEAQETVDRVGHRIVNSSAAASTGYHFEFHLLDDEGTVNAFALPGGQIFITEALYSRLESEDQLAGVLGHEVGHVIARHSAQQMAKAQLTQGLAGAAAVGAGDYSAGQIAQLAGQFVNMRYGRDDELESDALGVRFMLESGYEPEEMIRVMEILSEASGGDTRQPEFFSTHPNPENRIQRIREAIAAQRG